MMMSSKSLNQASNLAQQILDEANKYRDLPLDEFKTKTRQLQVQLANGKTENDLIVPAFALVVACSQQVLGMTPYLVQIIGGIALHYGMIAEMHTGEGKTLTATMPLYLNALSGKGVHLITVNSYLAKRDKEELTPLYNTLGLSVGFNNDDLGIVEKQKAYNCDITYTTNSAVGFDFLNDHLMTNNEEKRQRHLHYAIIDEIDSILIDEAQTPLVIAGHQINQATNSMRHQAENFVRYLPNNEVIVEKDKHIVRLKPSAVIDAKQYFGNDLFTKQAQMVHFITNALQARFLYINGVDYIKSIHNGIHEIALIDTNTGRILDGQQFSEGVHQAIQAKENVVIDGEQQTSATITYQSLLTKYDRVGGMTGTASTDSAEFNSIYNLNIMAVPPHKPIKRIDLPMRVFATKDDKFLALANEIVKYHDKHQPVLVGTSSVKSSNQLSRLLDSYGIQHETLNAENAELESKIVAKAGQENAITIATNMAGRGTDIKINDNVNQLGGLVVLGAEISVSPRIDNQLKGRCARQGQKGITQMFVSLEDDILQKTHTSDVTYYQRKYSQEISLTDFIDVNNEVIDKYNITVTDEHNHDISNLFYINYDDHDGQLTFRVKHPYEFLHHYLNKTVVANITGSFKANHDKFAFNLFQFNYLHDKSKLIQITNNLNDMITEHDKKAHQLYTTELSANGKFTYHIQWYMNARKLKRIKYGEIHSPFIVKLFNKVQKDLSKEMFENRKNDLGFENIIAQERDLLYQQRQMIVDRKISLYSFMKQITINNINNYFHANFQRKDQASLSNLQKINNELVSKLFSTSFIKLNFELNYYHSLDDVKQYLIKITMQELQQRRKLLNNSFNEVVRNILLKTIDYFFAKELTFLSDLKGMIGFENIRQANPYVVYQQKASESYRKMLSNIEKMTIQLFYQITISAFKDKNTNSDNHNNKGDESNHAR